MAPVPTKMADRLVPGTEWIRYERRDGQDVEIARGGVYVSANIDTTCFTLREISASGDEDLIHFCDWAELRATIDQFMADRAKEAGDG
jgi:hypothetical protein